MKAAGLVFLALFAVRPVFADPMADMLHLETEEYPPLNFVAPYGDNQITGISTEILRDVMIRAGILYDLELLPWERAYEDALKLPHHCVFSTTVTDERKALFKWVGPVATNKWVMYAAAGSAIGAKTLEDVRPYRIGGYVGDAEAQYLKQQGFNIEETPSADLNVFKLAQGRIELWATSSMLATYLAKVDSIPPPKALFSFKEVPMALACNRDLDDAMVGKMQAALDAMRKEHVVEDIENHYR
jgi:polar amino acid transport system substrate-binding protein